MPRPPFRFSRNSQAHLDTCHPDLILVFEQVILFWDCTVIEGHRTQERQNELLRTGATRTQISKHSSIPSRAVDVAPCPIVWKDLERFYFFAGFVKGIATSMHIPLRWGGDWDGDRDVKDQTFNDLVHFELR
jgi:peptidoglycan L-alanyl-D-glutamate endopeptidase CwlK